MNPFCNSEYYKHNHKISLKSYLRIHLFNKSLEPVILQLINYEALRVTQLASWLQAAVSEIKHVHYAQQ